MNKEFNGFKTYGFIGLGLIGGSIARAIRKYRPQSRIIAYNPSRTSLDEALADGVIDAATQKIDVSFSECDLIFLCAPVENNNENLKLLLPLISEECVITDIGSVKEPVHRSIGELHLNAHFIGGHPMAGSERTKYRNSKSELLENCFYILTPEPDVSMEKVNALRELVRDFRAIPLTISCSQHDYVVSVISHLPHVVAASLVHTVRDLDGNDGLMKLIAAGGFKDITRIASSSPVMWQQICITNKDNILKSLDFFIEEITKARDTIARGSDEELFDFFSESKNYRDSFTALSSGPISQHFVLSTTIADKFGTIADITAILAKNEISIKNINIVHSREYAEGTVSIEFDTAEKLQEAQALLRNYGYSIQI